MNSDACVPSVEEFGGLGNNRSIQLSYGADSELQRETSDFDQPRHTPATPEAPSSNATTAAGDQPKLKGLSAPERFTRFITPEPNTGCHLFTGATQTRGYGSFGVSPGKSMLAHRFAWEQVYGPIQGDLTVDHCCRVLTCCNVAHLQLVTHEVNAALSNSRLTHCARGHLRTPETVSVRPNGRRRCLACRHIDVRLQWGNRTEAEAVADARRDWPDLFAAAEKRIAGIVVKHARRGGR